MDSKTLNIEENRKSLVLKALNKANTIKEASHLLGITDRTVFRLIKDYRIEKEFGENGKYVIKPKIISAVKIHCI